MDLKDIWVRPGICKRLFKAFNKTSGFFTEVRAFWKDTLAYEKT